MIIDEGFGACDEDYLASLTLALEALACAPGGPRLVFVVSHVSELKARLERALEISVHPQGSRVANAAPAPPRAGARAPVVIRAGGTRAGGARTEPDGDPEDLEPAEALPPDPEHAGKVWCEACRQSLGAAWAAKHLASEKHRKALAKATGGARQ
jgi:hypothetical protein